jgi:hypothetical protein
MSPALRSSEESALEIYTQYHVYRHKFAEQRSRLKDDHAEIPRSLT